MNRSTWLVLPDQLSIRVFFDAGIVDGLSDRLEGRLTAVFLVPRDEAADWTGRLGGLPVLHGADLTAPGDGLGERALRRADATLDRHLGYHPLAIRLNHRHGFHLDRMQPGHPNWMLDSAREGPLPRWAFLERGMERWHLGTRRHVPRRLQAAMEQCSGLVVANVQPQGVVPFLVAARRRRVPVAAYVASWDHTVGKGVISPHCDLYLVQNRVMEDDLRRFHGIGPERVAVTGWPQTDVFHRPRPRAAYEALLRRYGLDPGRPLVLVMGNTPTNAPFEGRFVERLLSWWDGAGATRFQLLFRPHPRDKDWRERFGAAAGRDGVFVQEPSYTDLDDLAALLQHGDVVVCNAGTIMLDALVNDRPVVCVLYDEGAPPGESWAAKNVIGEHYKELAASGAFLRAGAFEDVTAGIERSLADPGELAEARRRVVHEVVGEVDGRAAERVVDAIVAALPAARAGGGR